MMSNDHLAHPDWPDAWKERWIELCNATDWETGTVRGDDRAGLSGIIVADRDATEAFYEVLEKVARQHSDWVMWLNARITRGAIPTPPATTPYYGESDGST